jgi:hypothetical protein
MASAGPGRAAARVRAPGKAAFHADSRPGGRADREPDTRAEPQLTVRLVCQDGTHGHDPIWDAPRLVPAFVAQLLGQMMPSAGRTAPRAYGAGREAAVPLLDLRS